MMNHTSSSPLRRYQELDDESILSGIYTESGDYASSAPHHTAAAPEPDEDYEDDEAFRRAVQAEQTRVMREFGLTPPPPRKNDSISISMADDEEESIADASLFTDAYSMPLPQYQQYQEEEDDTIVTFTNDTVNKNGTPETYPGSPVLNGDKDDDASTFVPPHTLFPTKDEDVPPLLTPRRLKLLMALLCAIVVVSIAVAMGSYVAQDKSKKNNRVVPNDVQVPDLGQLTTLSPTASPTESYNWSTTDDCVDHPSQTFVVNGERQDCVFLQNSRAAQRDRLCQPQQPGHRWCPATCGLCPRESRMPSRAPAVVASMAPSIPATIAGTARPTTQIPTLFPTFPPTTQPVAQPVPKPTLTPTRKPTAKPTLRPTVAQVVATPAPTPDPTADPTAGTPDPTPEPTTAEPTPNPTAFYFATPEPTYMETVVDTTAEPSPVPPSSFLCRTCPLLICELIPC